MDEQQLQLFRETVWTYYREHGRYDLPWRLPEPDGTFDAYKIMVSESMLQQTQVPRVIPKFESFIALFPTAQTLAEASLADVLRAWNGLGYNRRAKFLWQAAQQVMATFGGVLPHDRAALQSLPGIGPNTAGAIMAYAYNAPETFIETNIRTVFIHHFFSDSQEVSDAALAPLIVATLNIEQPREWYWALMDYGTHLKQTVGNASRASKSYAKQSAFVGSKRRIRGAVLRLLAEHAYTKAELDAHISDERLPTVLSDLEREGFITKRDAAYHLGTA